MRHILLFLLSCLASYSFAQEQTASKSFEKSDPSYADGEVDKMRDQVLNSKMQMSLFQQIIKNEGINKTYPKIKITFENKLSNRYKIYSVEYIVDGVKSYYYQVSEKDFKKQDPKIFKIEDFTSSLSPGAHTFKVMVNYVGNDAGVFSYLSEYKVKVEMEEELKFEKNTDYTVKVNAIEKSGLFVDFKEKANLSVEVKKSSKM